MLGVECSVVQMLNFEYGEERELQNRGLEYVNMEKNLENKADWQSE